MKFLIGLLPNSMGKRWSHKKGQTLVEYALILAVISVVLIAVMALLGSRIQVIFQAIVNNVDTAQSSH